MPLRTMARMTAFNPGQSPPPVSMPIFIDLFPFFRSALVQAVRTRLADLVLPSPERFIDLSGCQLSRTYQNIFNMILLQKSLRVSGTRINALYVRRTLRILQPA